MQCEPRLWTTDGQSEEAKTNRRPGSITYEMPAIRKIAMQQGTVGPESKQCTEYWHRLACPTAQTTRVNRKGISLAKTRQKKKPLASKRCLRLDLSSATNRAYHTRTPARSRKAAECPADLSLMVKTASKHASNPWKSTRTGNYWRQTLVPGLLRVEVMGRPMANAF